MYSRLVQTGENVSNAVANPVTPWVYFDSIDFFICPE